MRNQIKILVAALIVAAMVFSTGCPPAAEQAPDNTAANVPAAENAADNSADSHPDITIPDTCSAEKINERIQPILNGPLKNQKDLKIYATDVVRGGVTYAELIVSGKIQGDGKFQALNGIIQPLTKARSGPKGGPCVTAVKYITVAPDGASQTEDFEWAYCPIGTEPCGNGTCSADCGGNPYRQ